MRKLTRKPSPREMSQRTLAYLEAMSPPSKRLEEFRAGTLAGIPMQPKQRADSVNIDAVHAKQVVPLEKETLHDVCAMLAVHPKVVFAIRQNSGSASYEAKSGKWAPVHFYSFVKWPEPMTMPDVSGMLLGGKFFFLEIKRVNWTKPRDERERKQKAFLDTVRARGALAGFCVSVAGAKAAIDAG